MQFNYYNYDESSYTTRQGFNANFREIEKWSKTIDGKVVQAEDVYVLDKFDIADISYPEDVINNLVTSIEAQKQIILNMVESVDRQYNIITPVKVELTDNNELVIIDLVYSDSTIEYNGGQPLRFVRAEINTTTGQQTITRDEEVGGGDVLYFELKTSYTAEEMNKIIDACESGKAILMLYRDGTNSGYSTPFIKMNKSRSQINVDTIYENSATGSEEVRLVRFGFAKQSDGSYNRNVGLSNPIVLGAVANNLIIPSTSSGYILDARQGKVLNDKIEAIPTAFIFNDFVPEDSYDYHILEVNLLKNAILDERPILLVTPFGDLITPTKCYVRSVSNNLIIELQIVYDDNNITRIIDLEIDEEGTQTVVRDQPIGSSDVIVIEYNNSTTSYKQSEIKNIIKEYDNGNGKSIMLKCDIGRGTNYIPINLRRGFASDNYIYFDFVCNYDYGDSFGLRQYMVLLTAYSDGTYHVTSKYIEPISKTSVVDKLDSTTKNLPLSANQGRVLKDLIDETFTVEVMDKYGQLKNSAEFEKVAAAANTGNRVFAVYKADTNQIQPVEASYTTETDTLVYTWTMASGRKVKWTVKNLHMVSGDLPTITKELLPATYNINDTELYNEKVNGDIIYGELGVSIVVNGEIKSITIS